VWSTSGHHASAHPDLREGLIPLRRGEWDGVLAMRGRPGAQPYRDRPLAVAVALVRQDVRDPATAGFTDR
jgi:hypothetical protein